MPKSEIISERTTLFVAIRREGMLKRKFRILAPKWRDIDFKKS